MVLAGAFVCGCLWVVFVLVVVGVGKALKLGVVVFSVVRLVVTLGMTPGGVYESFTNLVWKAQSRRRLGTALKGCV